MNSRRRSQDPKEKREGKKEQTGISYFDWRNAKRKSKGKEDKSYKKRDCHATITCESAHRGSKDVVGAARQEEGLAHFRVAVLCAR